MEGDECTAVGSPTHYDINLILIIARRITVESGDFQVCRFNIKWESAIASFPSLPGPSKPSPVPAHRRRRHPPKPFVYHAACLQTCQFQEKFVRGLPGDCPGFDRDFARAWARTLFYAGVFAET